MTKRERDRLVVIRQVFEGKLSQRLAAGQLRISERQVRRSVRRYGKEGDHGLVHRLRGRRSNRRLSEELKGRVLARVRESYRDFGPTLAAEFLLRRDRLEVSRETLRGWMSEAGIWQARRERVRHRQWRPRRECYGELVQMDTSIHDWFEGRGEKAVLIAMVDDATSRLEARFYREDGTRPNMDMIRRYLRRHGRPLAIYADKASHFKTTRRADIEEALAGRTAETQVERALRELGIRYIAANSPQAKGRVERLFKTLQDRLIKSMRLDGISSIAAANEYLDKEFISQWGKDFSVPAARSADAHRRLGGYDLRGILSAKTTRTVMSDYTVHHEGRLYQIDRSEISRGLRRAKLIVEEDLEGVLRMKWRGRYLKIRQVAKVAWLEARTSGAGVGLRPPPAPEVRKKSQIPSPDHPWRKRTFLSCRKADISTLR